MRDSPGSIRGIPSFLGDIPGSMRDSRSDPNIVSEPDSGQATVCFVFVTTMTFVVQSSGQLSILFFSFFLCQAPYHVIPSVITSMLMRTA